MKKDEVKAIRINNESGSISGTLSTGEKFTTMGPKDIPETDAALLRDHNVSVEFYNPQPNPIGQLIPLLLPVVLIIAFPEIVTAFMPGASGVDPAGVKIDVPVIDFGTGDFGAPPSFGAPKP